MDPFNFELKAQALEKLAETQLAIFQIEEANTGAISIAAGAVAKKAARIKELVQLIRQEDVLTQEGLAVQMEHYREMLDLELDLFALNPQAQFVSLEAAQKALEVVSLEQPVRQVQ